MRFATHIAPDVSQRFWQISHLPTERMEDMPIVSTEQRGKSTGEDGEGLWFRQRTRCVYLLTDGGCDDRKSGREKRVTVWTTLIRFDICGIPDIIQNEKHGSSTQRDTELVRRLIHVCGKTFFAEKSEPALEVTERSSVLSKRRPEDPIYALAERWQTSQRLNHCRFSAPWKSCHPSHDVTVMPEIVKQWTLPNEVRLGDGQAGVNEER